MALSIDLGVFAKYWEPGRVKTRLAKSIGDANAAAVHVHLLRYTLATVDAAARLLGRRNPPTGDAPLAHARIRKILAIWPSEKVFEFRCIPRGLGSTAGENAAYCPDSTWELQPQAGGHLGDKISAYFYGQFGDPMDTCHPHTGTKIGKPVADSRFVLLIGSDCPSLSARLLLRAANDLQNHDVVLGPAEDGGYYLVGLSRWVPELFDDMPWSTPQLWEATLRAAENHKLSVATLPVENDVDTIDDLEAWLHNDTIDRGDNGTEQLAEGLPTPGAVPPEFALADAGRELRLRLSQVLESRSGPLDS